MATKLIKIEEKFLSYFFKPLPGIDLKKLKFTDVSTYSVTRWQEADLITDEIIKYMGGTKDFIITDATSNIGGNTISFHLGGIKKVNSCEIDTLTYKCLVNNLQVYKLPTENTYNSDYLLVQNKIKQDCVFFDPPWGGPDYYKIKILDLFLDRTNIIDICFSLLNTGQARVVILRVPLNFNVAGLKKKVSRVKLLTVKKKGKDSYYTIFCEL